MTFEKLNTLNGERFWNFGQQRGPEKCSIKEKAEIEHTYKALAIVAESQGKDINEAFKALYKECLYLRVLTNWQVFKPLTEEEKAAAEKRRKESEELWKSEDDDYSAWDDDDDDSEIEEKHYQNVWRFVEIMSTDYEQVTEEMKKEAVRLFPEVFESLGNFGEYVTCDGKEGAV